MASAEGNSGTKRTKVEVEPAKEDSLGTAAPVAQWTSTAKVSFGDAPSWLSPASSTTAPNGTAAKESVPAWLRQTSGAGSSTSFAPASSFGGGAAASFGGASSFGTEATFGGSSSSASSFGGAVSSFGSIAGSESVFGGEAKKKKDGDSKEDESTSDEDDDNGEEGEDNANEMAEWGTAGPTKDEENLPPPVDVATGEEGERQVFQTRAKLFRLNKGDKAVWSEMGVGQIRVNVPDLSFASLVSEKEDVDEKGDECEGRGSKPSRKPIKKPRLIMRRQGVLKLMLNAPIQAKVKFETVSENMLRFACESFTEDNPKGEIASFLLKFSREEERDRMLSSIRSIQQDKKS